MSILTAHGDPSTAGPGQLTSPIATRGGWAALSGVIAGAIGLGASDLAAWLMSPTGSPLTAVGQGIIALLPAGLVNFGKDTLGHADKPVLLGLVALGVLALSALAGLLEQRRARLGLVVFAAVAALGWFAVSQLPNSNVMSFVPTLVGLCIGFPVLRSLLLRLRRWQARHGDQAEYGDTAPAHVATPTEGRPRSAEQLSRRSFLTTASILGGVAVVVAVTGRALAAGANAVATARQQIRLPGARTPAKPIPAGADFQLADLAPYVTPNADFYRIDTALQVPTVDPAKWSLHVTGMVEREFEISFADLLAKPLAEHVATLACVSNTVGGDLVGNAVWLGYPIRDLLAEARPTAGADMVLSRSVDGFTAGTPLEVLMDPGRQSLLAVGMNGEPLPIEHGFPARLVVPGLYGYVSATKWVTSLKVTTFAQDMGYWTPLGWSAHGPIKIASRIDTPSKDVDAGQVMVAGVAWAQHTGIAGVEVRVDDGPWQPAELAEVTGPDTWRQWRYRWPAKPGSHSVTVRATDASGKQQTATEARPDPDGASGWHTVAVKVRG